MDTRFLARKLSPIEQFNDLKRKFDGVSGHLERNTLSCKISVRPTPLSDEYVLKVDYNPDRTIPFSVYVVKPKPLKLAKDADRLPHVYDQSTQRLCLYLPRKREWNASMLLSETAIPWAIEWLYFYETWLCTGTWLGGGEHPRTKN